jgi:hypothetical protein
VNDDFARLRALILRAPEDAKKHTPDLVEYHIAQATRVFGRALQADHFETDQRCFLASLGLPEESLFRWAAELYKIGLRTSP